MENNISKLYEFYRNNALLITKIRRTEETYRTQLLGSADGSLAEVTNALSSIEQYPQYLNKAAFQNSFINIASSFNSEDFVLLADSLNSFIYEVLIPIQQAVFEELSNNISEIYDSIAMNSGGLVCAEETAFGHTTLLYKAGTPRYLCSTQDPMLEGYILAKENFTPEADAYHIWGIGAGYHIYALYQLTHGSTDIYVYDNESFLFDIARSGCLGPWQEVFSNPRIHLITDPELTKFSSSLSRENNKCLIHRPSMLKLPENTEFEIQRKKLLQKLQITLISFDEQKNDIYLNFYKNIKYSDDYAENLFSEFAGQNVVVVAAGPSLDKNIGVLKKALEDGAKIKVICVGTVFKKLIKEGITPNAFFVMDAGKITYAQLVGVEDLKIPLIINTSSYYEFAQNYHGKKYLACQAGFKPAENLGHTLFNTGGSVTTLALDFAIQAKAKRIILIGCDMAFTDNQTHADGTAEQRSTKEESKLSVKGYYGGTINTGYLLSLYREWIENRIKSEDTIDIEIINATEGGAYIEGAKHISLKETLSTL